MKIKPIVQFIIALGVSSIICWAEAAACGGAKPQPTPPPMYNFHSVTLTDGTVIICAQTAQGMTPGLIVQKDRSRFFQPLIGQVNSLNAEINELKRLLRIRKRKGLSLKAPKNKLAKAQKALLAVQALYPTALAKCLES